MQNWLPLITALIVLANTVIGLILVQKIKQISINVDGRLSQLLALTAKSSHAEGVKDGEPMEGVHPLPPSRRD